MKKDKPEKKQIKRKPKLTDKQEAARLKKIVSALRRTAILDKEQTSKDIQLIKNKELLAIQRFESCKTKLDYTREQIEKFISMPWWKRMLFSREDFKKWQRNGGI